MWETETGNKYPKCNNCEAYYADFEKEMPHTFFCEPCIRNGSVAKLHAELQAGGLHG